ncbi:MAG: diguanylate cyclase [Lachnospiraceae bacterium]|nr:diguanylate cyclase [Lachnospiraceae bacterium]
MRSIRSKIILVYVVFTIFTVAVLLGISIYSINTLNKRDSDQLLEHLGRENAGNINSRLETIEHSVGNVEYYAYDQLEALFGKLLGQQFRTMYLENVGFLALNQVNGVENALSVYYRVTTDIKDEPVGFRYSLNKRTGDFEALPAIDMDAYESDDLEHVGWYYLPKKSKEPMWIGPYDSEEFGTRVMTYVYPVYVYGRFAGVIGMDVDIDELCDELREITVYNTGSAVLFDIEGNLLYNKEHEGGLAKTAYTDEEATILYATQVALDTGHPVEYLSDSGVMKLYACELVNGMTLCITAPIEEINSTQQTVLLNSIIASIIVILVSLIAIILVTRSFLRPLKELTEASEQLASGNFDVPLRHDSKDEIGQLSKTFELMANSLKRYFDHFHSLAYTDALTGLNNKAAYAIRKDVIESEVKMGLANFAIIVMDVNNLKTINDTLGHERGDVLLKHVTECLRATFVGFPLYRIGGDEFVTIINDADPDNLIAHLQSNTAKKSEEDSEFFEGVRYQIAAGAAIYNKNKDESFDDVFNRADSAMYENKKMLKARSGQTSAR